VEQNLEPGRGSVSLDKRSAVFGGCREPPRGHYLSTDIVSSNGAREVNTPAASFLQHINFSTLCVHSFERCIFSVAKAFGQWAVN
jgi:hypothetical protein